MRVIDQKKRRREAVKKITFAVLALIGLCVFGTPTVIAQDPAAQPTASRNDDAFADQQSALLRKDIRSIKKQLIAANLSLSDTEATKFWPVYEQYSLEFGKITDTRAAVIKEYAAGYGSLTDEQADNLIRRWLDTDTTTAQLRQKYVPIVRKALPG